MLKGKNGAEGLTVLEGENFCGVEGVTVLEGEIVVVLRALQCSMAIVVMALRALQCSMANPIEEQEDKERHNNQQQAYRIEGKEDEEQT